MAFRDKKGRCHFENGKFAGKGHCKGKKAREGKRKSRK